MKESDRGAVNHEFSQRMGLFLSQVLYRKDWNKKVANCGIALKLVSFFVRFHFFKEPNKEVANHRDDLRLVAFFVRCTVQKGAEQESAGARRCLVQGKRFSG